MKAIASPWAWMRLREQEREVAMIDCQLHVYEVGHRGPPWTYKIEAVDQATGEQQIAAMDAIGIDGAIIVSNFTTCRYHTSYAQEVCARHPGRFALIKPVSVTDPDPAEFKQFARDHLTPYQVPVAYKFVDSLPRTHSMKVIRAQALEIAKG